MAAAPALLLAFLCVLSVCAAQPAPAPRYCNLTPTNIGPGPSFVYGAAANDSAELQGRTPGPTVTTLCADTQYITKWDVLPLTPGPGVAAIRAVCSDYQNLLPVPDWNSNTPAWGSDVWQISDEGWSHFDAKANTDDDSTYLPYTDFLGVGGQPGQAFSCPAGQRAVGFTASAFLQGGLNLLEIYCAAPCPPNWQTNPVPSPSPPVIAQGPGQALAPGAVAPLSAPPPPPPAGPYPYPCNNSIQAHIGPGGYGAYATANASNDRSFYFELCPDNTFISSFYLRVDTYRSVATDGSQTTQTISFIGELGGNCSDGTVLNAASSVQVTDEYNGTYVEGQMTSLADSPDGYTGFQLTPDTRQTLDNFVGFNSDVIQPAALNCPLGYNTIGYSALAYTLGIAYLDVICGPIVDPNVCPPGPPQGGNTPPGGDPNGYPGQGGSQGGGGGGGHGWENTGGQWTPSPPSGNPPISPNNPSTNPSTNPSGRVPPPPPPGTGRGNTIGSDPSKYRSTQTTLRTVIRLTGPNLSPFNKTLQESFVKALASPRCLNISTNLITFVKATAVASTSGRRLLELQALGRHLLQTNSTQDLTSEVKYPTTADMVAGSQKLALAITGGNLTAALADENIIADAELESTEAQAATTTTRSGRRLSGGAIAGIVIGCVVGVALIVALAYVAVQRRSGRTPRYGSKAGSPATHLDARGA